MEMCNSLEVSRSDLLAGGGVGAAPHCGFTGSDRAWRRCDPSHLSFPTGTTSFTEVLFRETGLISAALGQKVPSRVIFYKVQTHFFYFFF